MDTPAVVVDHDESVFFTGLPVGTCQDALDTACGPATVRWVVG